MYLKIDYSNCPVGITGPAGSGATINVWYNDYSNCPKAFSGSTKSSNQERKEKLNNLKNVQ